MRVKEGPKQAIFDPFFDFVTYRFTPECNSKILNPSVTWTHVSGISMSKLELSTFQYFYVKTGVEPRDPAQRIGRGVG